ncbi:hypothetical protein ABHC40_12115 [Turicibacter sanguinis]|uniref:hypothetical protein n=1 Tax=Turicibacter sanguinis TaxID=154288 RepID=UPI00325C069D
MERIILLMSDKIGTGKPIVERLNNINVNPGGLSKIKYVEKCIIDAMNDYNPKFNVTKIEYLEYSKIQSQFPLFKEGTNHGLLIEQTEIDSIDSEIKRYRKGNWYVFDEDGKTKARRILMYLYLSNITEGSRNSFISQSIFPEMIDYIHDCIESPSYSMTNHKNCFINLLTKKVTAQSILRHLASLCVTGMDYIEVFNTNSLNIQEIPQDLKTFLERYTYKPNYDEFYNQEQNIFDNGRYKVDFHKKTFSLETTTLTINQDLTRKPNGEYDFHGSTEKFYWVEVLPMSIFAYNLGYSVDISKYEEFINKYDKKFSNDSEKMKRCKILLAYMKKYCRSN